MTPRRQARATRNETRKVAAAIQMQPNALSIQLSFFLFDQNPDELQA
jgi:hypothetical protein